MTRPTAYDERDARLTVLNTVASMLAYWGADLRCRFANAAYERWFGIDHRKMVGMSLCELVGPAPFEANKPHIDGVLSGRVQVFERVIPGPGGVKRPALVRYTPDTIDGAVVGFVVEVTETTLLIETQLALRREIAERAHAHELLRRSESALQQALKLGRIGNWTWEVAPDIITWSEQLYEIFGRDPSRMPPSYAEHAGLYTPTSWRVVQDVISAALADGEPFAVELEYVRPDGKTGWIEARGAAERDETGNVAILYGTAQEISHRKRSARTEGDERRLVNALRELEGERARYRDLDQALARAKKTEILGLLSAGIAHDFNNVLAAVSGSLHLLNRTAADARSKKLVDGGLRGIDRATRLVRQLMDFARTGPSSPARIDLADVVSECRDLLALSLGPTVTLRIDLPPGCMVEVDAAQLEVALINLIVNARDAMPRGGEVMLDAGALLDADEAPPAGSPGWMVLRVRDTGLGMAPDVLRRVKEPFYTTKAVGEGTGLGLSMVDAFARQAGGFVRIESRLGRGTLVSICLPRADDSANPAPRLQAETALRAPEPGVVILVVDDDAMVLPVVCACLRDLGYVAIEARSAAEGLAVARSNQPVRLVITDLRMREVDGLAFAARLRVVRPTLPVILMTGELPPHAELAGQEVLVKPFAQTELARRVFETIAPKPVRPTRLAGRIKHPAVLAAYTAWISARAGPRLPCIEALGVEGPAASENAFVAEVVSLEPFTLRRTFLGSALSARWGDPSQHAFAAADDQAFGRLEAAYRRCMRLREPSYEYLRMQLGEGEVVEFERLLLPCEAPDGSSQQLVGIVHFTDLPVGAPPIRP